MLFDDIRPCVLNAALLKMDKCDLKNVNDANLLMYVQKGSIKVKVDSSLYNLLPGDVLIIRKNTPYQYLMFEQNTTIIQIDFYYISQEGKKAGDVKFKDALFFNTTLFVNKIQLLEENLLELVGEFKKDDKFKEMKLSSCLVEVLSDVARRLKDIFVGHGEHKELLEKVILYINENYFENLTNYTLGAMFAVHPNYINTLMKKKTGYTIHNYLILKRISKSLSLLDETNLTIYEISEKCGFTESKNFIRHFKNMVGVTPGQYRKRK